MNSDAVINWVKDWGPLITLASTVILAGITAWLAILTKFMANSAGKAAEHSKTAAEASAASVAATEAAIDVNFDVVPRMGSTVGEITRMLNVLESAGLSMDAEVTPKLMDSMTAWRDVDLTCRGATVNVHGLTITFIYLRDPDSESRVVRGQSENLELQAGVELPRLCHAGEIISFEVPERPIDEDLDGFKGEVSYSFGTGAIRVRQVEWKKRRRRNQDDEKKASPPSPELETAGDESRGGG
ncbi:hypothetical protein [Nocardioides aurantiacus]|uniref:hypothetical protein n=1 Tax=Nocardioides aurantiacus TaxID=86796 RepID=UPI0011CDA258|nr:hypothetical protein [Nocardioides aurantiacus]